MGHVPFGCVEAAPSHPEDCRRHTHSVSQVPSCHAKGSLLTVFTGERNGVSTVISVMKTAAGTGWGACMLRAGPEPCVEPGAVLAAPACPPPRHQPAEAVRPHPGGGRTMGLRPSPTAGAGQKWAQHLRSPKQLGCLSGSLGGRPEVQLLAIYGGGSVCLRVGWGHRGGPRGVATGVPRGQRDTCPLRSHKGGGEDLQGSAVA